MSKVKHCDELIESSKSFFRTLKNKFYVINFYY